MIIPLQFATEEMIESLKREGFRCTGKVIKGVVCVCVK